MVLGCDPCGPKKRASEKVSETAKDLFYRHGIRAVGVDEIVTQAGVTKPSLYRSYSSKDDLISCCLREHAEESRKLFEAAVAKAPGDPRAQLANVLRAFADLAANEGFRGCPISNASVEFPDPDHPVHRLSREMKHQSRERLLSIVQTLEVSDPEALTDGLILLIEGAATSCQSYGAGGPAALLLRSGEALIDSYLRESQRG
jgi:AcrR family transcriptional regulator